MSGSPLCIFLASLLLVSACLGLSRGPAFDKSREIESHRTILQISHAEAGHEGLDDHGDNGHVGEDDGSFPVVHQHDPSELPVDHLVEVFGGNGILYESELDALIHVLK